MNKYYIFYYPSKSAYESDADEIHYENGYSEDHYKEICKDLFIKQRVYHIVIKDENDKYITEFNINNFKF